MLEFTEPRTKQAHFSGQRHGRSERTSSSSVFSWRGVCSEWVQGTWFGGGGGGGKVSQLGGQRVCASGFVYTLWGANVPRRLVKPEIASFGELINIKHLF